MKRNQKNCSRFLSHAFHKNLTHITNNYRHQTLNILHISGSIKTTGLLKLAIDVSYYKSKLEKTQNTVPSFPK